MYHQFKQLASLDITETPMEVGPTTHYAMGGVRVDADSQMSAVPGLFAAGEVTAGLNGANRLGGNSLSDLLVFGKRAGDYAAAFAKEQGQGRVDDAAVERAAKMALEPLERQGSGEAPYQLQYELQDLMQSQVGIVRNDSELRAALDSLLRLQERVKRVEAPGNREYNAGWHTALDLRNLMVVSEAVTRSAIERQESRGAHFREDYLGKDESWGKTSLVIRRAEGGPMEVRREPLPPLPDNLQRIIDENQKS